MKTTSWIIVSAGAIGMLMFCKLKRLNQSVGISVRKNREQRYDLTDAETSLIDTVGFKIKSSPQFTH